MTLLTKIYESPIIKNMSWLFIEKIIRMAGGLLIGVWVARYLGPKDFGTLNFASAYVVIFSFFASMGLDQIVVRELTVNPKNIYSILGSTFFIKLIGGLLSLIIIALSLIFTSFDNETKYIIFIVSLQYIFSPFFTINYFYQSKLLSKFTAISTSSAFIISSILKILFIYLEYDLVYFAFLIVIEYIITSLFFMFLYQKNYHSINLWKINFSVIKSLLSNSWAVGISIFVVAIYLRVDQIMIGYLMTNKDVGIYSIAIRLSQFWFFFPSIILSSITPYFITLYKEDKSKFRIKLNQLYFVSFWSTTLFAAIITIYGKTIISILYGDAYIDAYYPLSLNIWTLTFGSQNIFFGLWLLINNLQNYRMHLSIILLITNIVLNYVLIIKYGISGAALSNLLCYFMNLWIFSYFFKPLRNEIYNLIKSTFYIKFK